MKNEEWKIEQPGLLNSLGVEFSWRGWRSWSGL